VVRTLSSTQRARYAAGAREGRCRKVVYCHTPLPTRGSASCKTTAAMPPMYSPSGFLKIFQGYRVRVQQRGLAARLKEILVGAAIGTEEMCEMRFDLVVKPPRDPQFDTRIIHVTGRAASRHAQVTSPTVEHYIERLWAIDLASVALGPLRPSTYRTRNFGTPDKSRLFSRPLLLDRMERRPGPSHVSTLGGSTSRLPARLSTTAGQPE
jgi:hypothetical protein